MKRILLNLLIVSSGLLISLKSNAQSVGINSTGSVPDASAMLDVSSTTSGMLIPRMTESQRTSIASPAIGLMVYQTDDTTGFYFYDGSLWNVVSKGIGWGLAGNSGTIPGTDFIGTTDANDFITKTNNVENLRLVSATGNLVLGSGEGTATVTGNTLRAPNGTGTNIAGADMTITPGDGTGTGGSGNLIFETASIGSSGMTANTMTEKLRITNTGAIALGGASNYGASGNVFQSGGNGCPSWGAITLSNTNSVTGTLPVANGGTGLASVGANGTILTVVSGVPSWQAPATSGTVTSVSSGNLSPLFTTSVATSTSTPAISYSLTSAGAETIFGNNSGSSATPSYFSPSLASALFANQGTTTTILHGNASGNPSWSQVGLTTDVTGTLPVANGGTNSNTALSGSGIMISNGSKIVQGAAGTTTTLLHGNAGGAPTYSAVNLTSDVTGALPIANGGTGLSAIGGTNTVLYTTTANNISSITTADNGVFITSAGGVPSISTTIPTATQTNITELGTITTGTWNGTTIAVANGGTGLTTFGGTNTMLYTTAANTLSDIATADNGILITSAGGVPSISTTIPTATQTNITELGTITTGTWNGTTIAVANGGTGLTTFGGTNTMLYTSAANTLSDIATADNGVLVTGVSGIPSISTTIPTATQTNITELGTITTGTWNGTTIAVAHGGTGLTTYTAGSLIDASAAGTIGQINDVTAGSYLRSGGAGSVPVWSTLILPNAATKGDIMYASATNTIGSLTDVAVGDALLSGGVGAAPTYGKVALASAVSGTLPIANGGTDLTTTPANGDLLIGNGTNYTLTTLTAGTGVSVANASGSIILANTGVTSITGTANQVTASASTGAVTLSLPQSIATGSSPTFTGLNLSGLTASSEVYTDGSENLTSTIPSSGTLGFWTLSSGNLYPSSLTDALGIGTNSPAGDAGIAIANGHLEIQQTTAATYTTGANNIVGTGNTITLTNASDVSGSISIKTGNTGISSEGTMVTLKFNASYTYTPVVILMPTNATAASAMSTNSIYVTPGTANFTIDDSGTSLSTGTTYTWNYFVIEPK